MSFFVHELADVQSSSVGENTRIWQYVIVLGGAKIGGECNICSHVFIENDVIVGDRVTIKSGVQLWDGVRLQNDVFVGPNVTFTNDKFPRSKKYLEQPVVTSVHSGASLGAGCVILPGLTIGANAMVGAGAVVTRSIPPNAIVAGNPARIIGYVDADKHRDSAASLKEKVHIGASRVAGVELYRMPRIIDIRGSLTVGEFERTIPFTVRRYFIVFDVPSVETRGEHAHKECHQFLVCVRGSVSVVADDGENREEFVLNSPDIGLHLPPMVWGIQYKYSPDAMLLVFASHYYDSADYVRDYAQFISAVGAE